MLARKFLRCLLLASLLFGGCEDPTTPTEDASRDTFQGADGADTSTSDTPDTIEGFDNHSVSRLESVAAYERFATSGVGKRAVKFTISDFDGSRSVSYMDTTFYTLHDEWYWFQLLNGEPIEGLNTLPIEGLSFIDVPAVYAWAEAREVLPLDLRINWDGRLYSPEFYSLSLGDPRFFGLGTLMFFEAAPPHRDALWVFELEYSDAIEYQELVGFFETLERSLPPEIADDLRWVIRSPVQESLAVLMERDLRPYHDRILRYRELAIPGEIEVYSEGLSAGRLRISRGGEGLDDARSTDILVLDAVPDWLPPASGLITAVPQTPLAHINVLARNRGIPNAYKGGVLDDPALNQLARVRAPVILRATIPDQLELISISESEFAAWRARLTPPPISLPPVDLSALPLTLDLSTLLLDDVEAWRPIIGGKSAGFLSLIATPSLELPYRPFAITLRAYAEHIERLQSSIEAMLQDPDFLLEARARFLLLEGPEDYAARFSSSADAAFSILFLSSRPSPNLVGDLVRDGGLKKALRDLPIDPTTLAQLEADIEAHFSALSPSQGLRFRSSSTIEDIEGFNGAGLYDSNTGFRDALDRVDPNERKKTIAWALKKTWSSYWSFEAFEERRLESIDHASGHMAVLVHPRFDDPLELSNGVLTITLYPPHHPLRASMTLNAQLGSESVTNPTNTALPEVDEVSLYDGASAPVIERVRASTLTPPGEPLLNDQELTALFEQTVAVAERWLEEENSRLTTPQAGRTLTLDLEYREMGAAWPVRVDGAAHLDRVVLKQARSLEPGLRLIPESLRGLPFPRDVLARARRIERRECQADALVLITTEAYTDPLSFPDLGHQHAPFSAFVSVRLTDALPTLALDAGALLSASHDTLSAISHPDMTDAGSAWQLLVTPSSPDTSATGIGAFHFKADGSYSLTGANGVVYEGTYSGCETELLHSSPEDYLLSLIEAQAP